VKKLYVLILTGLIGTSAHAGFLIEPYLGYRSGDLKTTTLSNVSGKEKYTSPVIGARLGWSFLGLWTGFDYEMGTSGESKPESGPSIDVDSSVAYLAVGYNLPVMFRAWAGYGLIAELNRETASTKSKIYGGAPVKIGFGYTGLPLVSINFEYFMWEPKKIESGGIKSKISNSYSKYELNAMMLSVSIPL
jgi:hypothetical protein